LAVAGGGHEAFVVAQAQFLQPSAVVQPHANRFWFPAMICIDEPPADYTGGQIKGWSRAKKEALIAGDWQRISALSRNRQC